MASDLQSLLAGLQGRKFTAAQLAALQSSGLSIEGQQSGFDANSNTQTPYWTPFNAAAGGFVGGVPSSARISTPLGSIGEGGAYGNYSMGLTQNPDGSYSIADAAPSWNPSANNASSTVLDKIGDNMDWVGPLAIALATYGAGAGAAGAGEGASTAGSALGTTGSDWASGLATTGGQAGIGGVGAGTAAGGAASIPDYAAGIAGPEASALGTGGASTIGAVTGGAGGAAPIAGGAGALDIGKAASDLLGNKGLAATGVSALASALATKPSVNTGATESAAANAAGLAQEDVDWTHDYLNNTLQPQQNANTERANAIADAQQLAMQTSAAGGKASTDLLTGTFNPLYKKIVDDAAGFNTEDARLKLSSAAGADAQAAFQSALDGQRRDWARIGYTPTTGMRAALDQDASLASAAGIAKAANDARFKAMDIGYQRTQDAAKLGGQVSQDATSQNQTATQAGTNAASVSSDALARAQVTPGVVNNAYSTAIGGNAQAANAFSQAANASTNAANVNNDLIGTVAGTAVGALLNSKK